MPIKFDSHGDLVGGKFFLFKINSAGKYQLIPEHLIATPSARPGHQVLGTRRGLRGIPPS